MDKLASKGQKKCSFIEYFNNIPGQDSVITPKDAFRKRIQELTGCGPSAVIIGFMEIFARIRQHSLLLLKN